MTRPIRPRSRPGFTLVELVLSVATASILAVGLSSAMFIALRASDPSISPARAAVEGQNQLAMMYSELQYALAITEASATAVTASVPDRDNDGSPETITYLWTAEAGAPLVRQYNEGPVSRVLENVHKFDVQYYQPDVSVEHLTVSLQVSADEGAHVQTAIPLLNHP